MTPTTATRTTTALADLGPIIDAIHAEAEAKDPAVLEAAFTAAAERNATNEDDVADVLTEAYMPIDAPNGELLHILAAGRRPGRVVEFGTSMGLSAIYLAAALRPDEPPIIATEVDPIKVERARNHLKRAGIDDRVEIRVGDAFETLADLNEPISLLFLDGWKRLYLPMLEMLEPLLVDGAFVVADDTLLFADQCEPLLSYLRSPGSGYFTASIPIGDGMEIASRAA